MELDFLKSKLLKNIINENSYWKGVRHMHSPDTVTKYQLVTYINDVYSLGNTVIPTMLDYCYRSLTSKYEFSVPKKINEQILELKSFKVMITFPHLGYLGRLGNQMFQYSALLSLARRNNLNFHICRTNLELYKCFNIPTQFNSYYHSNFVAPHNLGNEIVVDYTTLLLNNSVQWNSLLTTNFDSKFLNNTNHNNQSIFGFFQNYKYFEEIQDDLYEIFTFKSHYSKICKTYFKQIYPNTKTLAMHIRRTDYLDSSVLKNLSFEYYHNALEQFDSSISVLVFSDDIEWCKEQSIFNDNRFIMMESNNTYIDLCLMSFCDYHIIANSSFSWWGSWLAKSKKTICPKEWFSSKYLHLDSDGLRLPHWISI